MTTGFLLDNTQSPRLTRLQQRLLEGLLQGLVMTGVSYLVCVWLRERGTPPPEYKIPLFEQVQVMISGGIIGFVLGFCVPTWRREAHADIRNCPRRSRSSRC